MFRVIVSSLILLSVGFQSNHALSSPAEHLGQAVRYRTVSEQDPGKIDYSQFQQFHEFMRATYPRVFAELQVEQVNHSLLLLWPGTDSSKLPILLPPI